MKSKKLLLTVFLGIFTVFAFIGCQESNSLFNSLLRTTQQVSDVTNAYDSVENESAIEVEELSFTLEENQFITLADTNENDLVRFNELRLELLDIHSNILTERDALIVVIESIQNSVALLKDKGYVLLEGDETIIKEYILDLQTLRQGLLDTKGLAYQRINDLQGTYTRENLANINTVFEEVSEVLTYRLDTVKEAKVIFENIETLLLDYLV